jgi:hypothetical protein
MSKTYYPRPYGVEDGIRYTYYGELMVKVNNLGYSTVKEAIIDLYEKLGGTIPVAKKLGLSKGTIYLKLKAFGHPIKGKGGANNPFGIKGKPKG